MSRQCADVVARPHRHLELSPSISDGPLNVLAFPFLGRGERANPAARVGDAAPNDVFSLVRIDAIDANR